MENIINTNFLTKAEQKNLIALYKTACEEYWRKMDGSVDTKMVDYCVKSVSVLVPFKNGSIGIIDKSNIDTNFWFGYSNCGQGLSYDECNRTMDHVQNNIAEYFKEKNMQEFDRLEKDIAEAKSNLEANSKYSVPTISTKYYGQNKANPMCNVNLFSDPSRINENDADVMVHRIDMEELLMWEAGVKQARKNFNKRLDAYLKRFGTSKLSVHRYWVDR